MIKPLDIEYKDSPKEILKDFRYTPHFKVINIVVYFIIKKLYLPTNMSIKQMSLMGYTFQFQYRLKIKYPILEEKGYQLNT